MNIIQRLRYRWEHCEDVPPGPIQWEGYVISVLYMTPVEEEEEIMLLRRLRAVLTGHGPAWTFWAAMWDRLQVYVIAMVVAILISVLILGLPKKLAILIVLLVRALIPS